MVLTFTQEDQQFLNEVQRFVDDCVSPNPRAWEADTFPADIWKRTAQRGISTAVLPKAFGGRGFSCGTYPERIRILAKGDPALAMNVAAINALCVAHFE